MNKIIATALLILGVTFTSLSWGLVGLQQATVGNLSAFIMPEKDDARGDTNVYMAALFQGNWFVRNEQNWEVFTEIIPVADKVSLLSGIASTLIASADLSTLPGLEVYVGYGDINLPGHVAKVYTVPTPVVTTCTQTSNGCLYPRDVWVTMPTSFLSYEAWLIGDAGWVAGLKDGTIKPVDTGMIMTGYSNRPIVFMTFKRDPSITIPVYCTTPVYKDDGKQIGLGNQAELLCGGTEMDRVMGTDDGIITHRKIKNDCFLMKWFESELALKNQSVTCTAQ